LATPKTTINIHPKLFTGLLIGLATAAVGGIASAMSPDLFAALGVWGPPVFSLTTVALSVLGGWLKRVNAPESETAAPAPVAAPAPAPAIAQAPVSTATPIQVQLVEPATTAAAHTATPSRTQSNIIA
jgi:hypothetical protein